MLNRTVKVSNIGVLSDLQMCFASIPLLCTTILAEIRHPCCGNESLIDKDNILDTEILSFYVP